MTHYDSLWPILPLISTKWVHQSCGHWIIQMSGWLFELRTSGTWINERLLQRHWLHKYGWWVIYEPGGTQSPQYQLIQLSHWTLIKVLKIIT